MDESSTKNDGLVELAVRRQLAYRNKLAGLGFHAESLSGDLMSFQVPSSSYQMRLPYPSAEPMPTRNKFQTSQSLPNSNSIRPQNLFLRPLRIQHPFPKPIPEQNQKQIPGSNSRPNTAFPTASPTPNLSGTKRKELTSNEPKPSLTHPDYITRAPEGYSYCNICEVPCSCRLNLIQHLKGNQHKNKMQLLEWTKKGVSRPFCETCHISCTDEDGLKMHYNGKKHKSKLRQLEVGEERKEHRTCDLCKIWCMDEGAYQQHLRGKNHIARLYEDEIKKSN